MHFDKQFTEELNLWSHRKREVCEAKHICQTTICRTKQVTILTAQSKDK
ncbi:hypothetical protein Patl1_24609 [Pistacia atlantica]|uniref:Uncharacterized protein n=1 Tax=Pistacia atlantica TaxID=434234 RepID=A0ACC1A132_9ROSI|nr:hypothetical protein Patl1_24609 [Pistacia atlantica]